MSSLASIAVVSAVVVFVVGWVLLGPIVARRHAVAVRREHEATCRELAWYYWAPDERVGDNWVADRIAGAARPLRDDFGQRAFFGPRARPAVPPAEGLDELQLWIEDELAEPTGAVTAPPDAATRLLARRAPELDEVRAILLAGDAPRFSYSNTRDLQDGIHRLLLGHALASIRSGDMAEADRDLVAAWRLARSLNRPAYGWTHGIEMSGNVAVALRKMPRIRDEWQHRLDVQPVRDAARRMLVMEAATSLRCAEDMSRFYEHAGAERRPVLDSCIEPILAWQLTSQARGAIERGQSMADPSRLVSQRLDTLAAQFELSRKVAQLQRLRAAGSGRWPDAVPGIALSDCAGLAWTYSGGDHATLAPAGPAAGWFEPAGCEPALRYVSAP